MVEQLQQNRKKKIERLLCPCFYIAVIIFIQIITSIEYEIITIQNSYINKINNNYYYYFSYINLCMLDV